VKEPLPAWFHEDNRFRTRRRMLWAHAPIVALAERSLGGRGGNVLDVGCGNGALLARIVSRCPGTVPYGVDVRAVPVSHARRLLPRYRRNLLVGDAFLARDRARFDRPYALVLLSPRRLHDAGPEAAGRLLDWLRPRCARLLVYAYGTGLRRRGGLAGFAAPFGVRLRGAARRPRAAIASRF
jgi:SAM-dependent methyltransferase